MTPEAPFTVGLEDELLLVDPDSRALAHAVEDVIARMELPERSAGFEAFAAEIELRSSPRASAEEAARELRGLRAAATDAGATLLGLGVHPQAALGDVRITRHERYRKVEATMRGLIRRTPECALHVHVGMPNAEAALRAHNGLRPHLPLLQALAANSPWWFGQDSGLASARYALTRAYPRRGVPRPLRDVEEWEQVTQAAVAAGGLEDYTSLWWDVRPHPRFGTVEVREMDVQSRLEDAAALGALVQALAADASEATPASHPPSEALEESSFRAARDGLGAAIVHDGRLAPVPEVARAALARARPTARELGSDAALEGIERILREGCGADRRRAAHARGGIDAMLDEALAETVA